MNHNQTIVRLEKTVSRANNSLVSPTHRSNRDSNTRPSITFVISA
jgi:hypothetical protein